MPKTIAFLVLTAVFQFASAQDREWKWVNPKPTGNTIFSVQMPRPGIAVAVGERSNIFRSEDGGATWSTIPGTFGPEDLYCVAFADSSLGLAVGGGGKVLRTTDGGRTWKPVNHGLGTASLRTVSFPSPLVAVVGGTNGAFWRSADGGLNWSRIVQENSNNSYLRISFANEKLGLAIGSGANQDLFLTTDGGITWSPIGEKRSFSAVAFADSQTAVMIGRDGVFRTTDGGLNWAQVGGLPPVDPVYFTFATFVNEKVGFITGSDKTVLRTADGGASWSKLSFPFEVSWSWHSIAFGDSINGVAVGMFGIIYRTQDAGLSWTRISRGTENAALNAVTFPDASLGFAVGASYNPGAPPQGLIYISRDGGLNWERTTPPSAPVIFNGVAFATRKRGVVVGGSGFILLTEDGGKTWSRTAREITSQPLNAVAFADQNLGMALGAAGTVLRTSNGGRDWELDPRPLPTGIQLQSVAFPTPGWAIAVGYHQSEPNLSDPPEAVIFRSATGGQSWQRIAIPSMTGMLRAVAFADSAIGFAAGDVGLLRTENAGQTWVKIQLPDDAGPNPSLWSISFASPKVGITTGWKTIYRTTDGGKSWVYEVNAVAWNRINAVACADGEIGVAVGEGALILRPGETHFGLNAPLLMEPEEEPLSVPTLKWGPVEGALGYQAQTATDPRFAFQEVDSSLSDTSLSLVGRTNSSALFWRVRALNANGPGPWTPVSALDEKELPVSIRGRRPAQPASADNHAWMRTGPRGKVQYYLPKQEHVVIKLLDARGKSVRVFAASQHEGFHHIQIFPNRSAPGEHFIAFKAGSFSSTVKFAD